MIWPFRPHPPLSLNHKVTCERRFAEIGRLLRHRLPRPATIVRPEEIATLIDGCSQGDLPQSLFGFMRARIFPEDTIPAGWAEAETLTINGQSLPYAITSDETGQATGIHFHPLLKHTPERLAAVTATAAAEHLVCSQKLADRLSSSSFELIPLFFGFGPLMSHAAMYELPDAAKGLELTRTARVGAVSPLDFGYSMALADWSLKTNHEDFLNVLRLDAKEGLQKGLRFLRKTNDCSFETDFLERQEADTVGFVMARLQGRSHSRQLNTLLDLYSAPDRLDDDLMEPVAGLLRHPEAEIQRMATATLARCSILPRAVHDELVILAEDGSAAIRRAAVSALRPGYDNDDSVLEMMIEFLRRSDRALIAVSLNTLLKYNSWPDGVSDAVLKALSTMVLSSGMDDLALGVRLLEKAHADPDQALTLHFADDPTALAIFAELKGHDPELSGTANAD
ncbi:MAG: hypothetical protein R3C59_03620 [Planctomycetaceae bacterium]